MKARLIAFLLCATLLLTLAGCGMSRQNQEPHTATGETEQDVPQTARDLSAGEEELQPPQHVEAVFPLISRPFSDAESEAMANHNARRCALMVLNYYYCRCLYADGSTALVRYEIIDNNLRHRTILVSDCPADCLSEENGRLYYLNASDFPESVGTDGTERRTELDAACLSLQLRDGTLYCLVTDGVLLAVREGKQEELLSNCTWAFVSEQGIFYTSSDDGRAYLLDLSSRTAVTLTDEAAQNPIVIGTMLYYSSEEPDGLHLRALDLATGTQQRMNAAFHGKADYFRAWDGRWQLRASSLAGASGQQVLYCTAAFDPSPAVENVTGSQLRRCRGIDDVLHTDELFSPDGSALGFELVLPGGGSYASLAADNQPES